MPHSPGGVSAAADASQESSPRSTRRRTGKSSPLGGLSTILLPLTYPKPLRLFLQALMEAVRTTNAIEQLNREFRRRIKTQTLLPCAETVPMLFWALLASGQIQMRKVDGWAHLSQTIQPFTLDLAA